MALDPSDPYYRAELISPAIAAMEHPLCDAYGVGLGNFGSKGNTVHTSGYHRSRNWVLHSPDSAHGSRDYSVQLAADNGNPDDVAAFDFTPGVWGSADNRSKMKTLTQRLLTACQAHDPRVANLREFAGTLDGSNVVTWDCSRNAFKTPFDSSHLDHVHGSIYRSKTRADHSGIVSVMLGVPLADWTQDQINNACYTLGITADNPHPLHARLNALEPKVDSLGTNVAALLARPPIVVDAALGDQIATGLANNAAFIGNVVSAIVARLGHVPTAQENADAVIAEIAS
jgi:hypothetical protein